jgi:hypothetical protein
LPIGFKVALIKDGITPIVNGFENDDHAKPPSRKDAWDHLHTLLGIPKAQPVAIDSCM